MSKEVYISIDIEADGPCPGVNSMWSLGAAAFSLDRTADDQPTFQVNLYDLYGARSNPDTMAWWKKQPEETYLKARADRVPCDAAMRQFEQWCNNLKPHGKLVGVAYPAGFDFTFVYYYCHRFLGYSPLGFSCIDIKSFAMALAGTSYRDTTKKTMSAFNWLMDFDKKPHTHVAVEDAIEQGHLFMQMLKESRKRSKKESTDR